MGVTFSRPGSGDTIDNFFSFYFVAYLFLLGFLCYRAKLVRRVLWVDLFSSIEVQQVAAKEYVQWVWSDGNPTPGLGELTIVDSVLSSVLSVYSGEFASVGEMNFRDPNIFLPGDVHNHVGPWDVILQGYERRDYFQIHL